MKKSKFLKKSLAMLLALMLVVAMIPLSASAAPQDDLKFIYVDNNMVTLADAEVDVKDDASKTSVQMRLNAALSGYQLRVLPASQTELNSLTLTTSNQDVYFNKYMNAENEITLQMFKQNGSAWEEVEGATYTVKVNKVSAFTTTNIEYVGWVKGVYSATVDTVNKIVNVELARNVNEDGEGQGSLGARMEIKALEGATISGGNAVTLENGNVVVDADEGDTFQVTSQSTGNVATYTVKVSSYLEALSSFTVTGTDGKDYTATPVDTNDDNIPDTITVNLPEEAIWNSIRQELYTDPELSVSYEAEGDVTANVEVQNSSSTKLANVLSDGSAKVKFAGLGTGDQEFDGKVVITRLSDTNGAVQTYTLKVQLEKSSSTEITYAKVNSTLATVDAEAGTIKAEVPTADKIATQKGTVVLKTAATVQSVTLNSVTMTTPTSEAAGVATWEFTSVDLSKSQIVDVVAEDNTKQQYTLTASTVSNATDATITAIWIKDGAKTYEAEVTAKEDNLLVKVPYMTTDVSNWTIFVTPSSYTYVTYGNGTQLVNGETKLGEINTNLGSINADGTWSIEVTANNKNNDKIKKTYTLTIDLEDAKDGKTLADLDFSATAQDSDKLISLNIEKDVNTFDAQIETKTNSSTNVANLNLYVPVSLTTDELGITYQNVVTNFATNNGGVAYVVTSGNATGSYIQKLTAINPNNASGISGTVLADAETSDANGDSYVTGTQNGGTEAAEGYWQILVLPEKTARAWENSEINGKTYIPAKEAATGTLYNVYINVKEGSSLSELKTFKVGNTTLTIDGDKITGEIPFSMTSELDSKTFVGYDKAVFAEFTTSPYARLYDTFTGSQNAFGVSYFSKGDIDGDTVVDEIDDSNNSTYTTGDYVGYNNYKLAFVRNDDPEQSVTVYRVDDGDSQASAELDDQMLVVRAENRLNNKTTYSLSKYTFELTWAAPCEEADIETFKLGGYTGVINNDSENGRTIKVTVPYGTDVTGLVADFTASSGAEVKLGSTSGMDFVSGVTSVNYSMPVQLWVTSEDGDTTHMYTVTVEEGISFTDVNAGDWFYDNVMDAAENGYVSGMGDGTFNPTGATTRAQFASMIAKAMGYEENPDSVSKFPDVADNYWGKAAINFCAENGIISGYDDGTFQPEKAITRQEAAAILNNAFELAEKYDISTELYPDNGAIADWASDHVYAAKAAGLMKGDAGTGMFRPTSTITRAEAASILMNANRAGLIK